AGRPGSPCCREARPSSPVPPRADRVKCLHPHGSFHPLACDRPCRLRPGFAAAEPDTRAETDPTGMGSWSVRDRHRPHLLRATIRLSGVITVCPDAAAPASCEAGCVETGGKARWVFLLIELPVNV